MRRYSLPPDHWLGDFELQTLEDHPQPVHAISSRFELLYFNPAWVDFYRTNSKGGPLPSHMAPGAAFLDFIQGPERAYYEKLYGRVMKERKVLRQTFECHSPELFRIYDQILYPLKDGKGIVVINSLKKERKWDEEVRSFAENVELAYLMQDAFYHQCSNCRKTLRNDGSGEWDLIPGHLENPPSNISHTICPVCFEHYWKGGAA